MKKLFAYLTGGLALLIVVVAIISATIYAASHNDEALKGLATATLQGIGMAIGSVIGGYITLRFQVARTWLKNLLKDIQ